MRSLSSEEMGNLARAIEKDMELRDFELVLEQIGQGISPDDRETNFSSQIFRIISIASADGWHAALLNALMSHLSESQDFLALARKMGLTGRGALEAAVAGSADIMDAARMRRIQAKLENRVCRVEVNTAASEISGTGFLVGPDLVLTNYHVVEVLIKNEITPDKITIRFDFKTLVDNNNEVLNDGTEYKLHSGNPVLASSRYDEMDTKTGDLNRIWPEDHLDFALLKLEKEAGKELPGGLQPIPGTKLMPRGWIPFPTSGFTLERDDQLMILQHPQKEPISLGWESNGVIGHSELKRRMRHRVNTLKGSSGSPCFNSHWKLVAIHHAGDPLHFNPGYNQGIPINLIALKLKDLGLKELITFGKLELEPIEIPDLPAADPVDDGGDKDDPAHSLEQVYLNEVAPFIQRSPFKRAMKKMIGGDGGHVVLLEGKSKTGLSYSYHFIQQASTKFGHRCIHLSLKQLFSQAGTATSLPLAGHIIRKMKIDYDLPNEEEFKLEVFFSSFVGIVGPMKDRFLLFIDDLADFPMTTECINFIRRLATVVINELPKVCLVLAGFKESLPIEISPVIRRVSLTSFSEKNIEQFFRAFYDMLPALTDNAPDESQDEFVTNSLKALKESTDLNQEPNVEEVGASVRDYCELLMEDLME